MTFETQYATSC